MKSRFSRILLMTAGIITVFIILLSQSLPQATETSKAAKKEQSKDHPAEHHVSVAPDVLPLPALQLDKNTPSLLKFVTPESHPSESIFPDSRVFVAFFTSLLRAAISPNAP